MSDQELTSAERVLLDQAVANAEKVERLTAKIERLERELRLEKRTSFALRAEQKNTNDSGQEFFVEEAKDWFWVTERSTNHNYAQTDNRERADQICRDLNAGIREFEEDGSPANQKDSDNKPRSKSQERRFAAQMKKDSDNG